MRFMNVWDIERAAREYAGHEILGPATVTLQNLQVWADSNSDGWAHWPKPCRAAARLMEMIERDGTWEFSHGPRPDVTAEEYRAALRPVKAFRTRHGADFGIVEPRL